MSIDINIMSEIDTEIGISGASAPPNLAEAMQRMDSSRFERCIVGKKTKYCCFCCISSWACVLNIGQGFCSASSQTCIFFSDLALGCNHILEKMECEDGSKKVDWK